MTPFAKGHIVSIAMKKRISDANRRRFENLREREKMSEAMRNSPNMKFPVNVRRMRDLVYETLYKLPQTCYFCGEEIINFGRGSESLDIHSLDGNHNNFELTNKAPSHHKCHTTYHHLKIQK